MAPTQPDMGQRSPVIEGENHLTILPAELLTNIVERLPVREICRLRSLSRHMRDFIDTSQEQLTRDPTVYHRARIKAEYKLLIDLSDCEIIDALKRYDSHYGLKGDTTTFPLTWFLPFKLRAMSLTFYLSWVRSHGFPSSDRYRDAGTLMQVYFFFSQNEYLSRHSTALSSAWNLIIDPWCFGFTGLGDFMAKFTQGVFTKNDVPYASVPPYFLTERKIASAVFGGRPVTRKGHCDHLEASKLQLLLNIPELQYERGAVAYCSMSGSALYLVDDADQGPLATLKQAAIIEEIFIW